MKLMVEVPDDVRAITFVMVRESVVEVTISTKSFADIYDGQVINANKEKEEA